VGEQETPREWAESLRRFMIQQVSVMDEAKRRLWAARDEHSSARLRWQEAKSALASAERDYEEQRELIAQSWDFFRSEYEKAWAADARRPVESVLNALIASMDDPDRKAWAESMKERAARGELDEVIAGQPENPMDLLKPDESEVSR
jgi:hypothetical protein